MKSGIYKIFFVDTPNKIYIGSSKNIEKRKKQHLKGLRDKRHINPLLQYAFGKYGEEKLIFEEIEICDEKKLIERERYFYYEALEKGLMVYNQIVPDIHPTNSGRTRFKKGLVPWNAGRKGIYSKEMIQRLSKARLGKIPWNKGTKGLMNCWNKGKKMSEEHCKKLSEAHKNQIPWFKKRGIKPPANTGRTRFKKK